VQASAFPHGLDPLRTFPESAATQPGSYWEWPDCPDTEEAFDVMANFIARALA